MSTIVTRAGKGSPLTNNEVDSNFVNLNTDKIEVVGTPTGGQAVVWDAANSRWIPGTAASRVTLSSSAPSGPTAGDRWLDADTGIEYLYTDDGDSSQWVEFGPTALAGTSLPDQVGNAGKFLTTDGTDTSWGTATTPPAGSTGQVQYNNAGAFGAISSGTSGQVLTSEGSGSAPTWATPSNGPLQLLSTVNIANVRIHNFTGLSSNFNYQLYVTAKSTAVFTASSVLIQLGTGTATTSSYYWGGVNSNGTTLTGSEQDAGTAFYPFGNVQDLSNGYTIQISANIFTQSSQNPTFQCLANGYGNGNNTQTAIISGVNLSLTSISSIHLNLGSTNFTGSIYLLGVKNA